MPHSESRRTKGDSTKLLSWRERRTSTNKQARSLEGERQEEAEGR
jgi:hypothetical protein